MRGPHHQANVVRLVPLTCLLGHHLVEPPRCGPGAGWRAGQALEVGGPGVGGPAEYEHGPVSVGEKGLHRIKAHVGIHGGGVEAEDLEQRPGIGHGVWPISPRLASPITGTLPAMCSTVFCSAVRPSMPWAS